MSTNDTDTISKSNSWKMFDDISPKYDFLNHVLSFGLDILWRRQLAQFLPLKRRQKILDLATGTGDVLISMFQNNPNVQSGCGVDLAGKMMEIGRKKIADKDLESQITLHHGDAHQIPFNDHTFDTVSIAFGIRNMQNHSLVLTEMYRVLNKGGRVLVLEFSLPQNPIIRGLHIFYLRHIVPLIGAVLSRYYQAYKYLNKTIEAFPYGDEFCSLMKKAGFQNTKASSLFFGVATIYQGDKLEK